MPQPPSSLEVPSSRGGYLEKIILDTKVFGGESNCNSWFFLQKKVFIWVDSWDDDVKCVKLIL